MSQDDESSGIQPPSNVTVDEAPPQKVLLYGANGNPVLITVKRAGFDCRPALRERSGRNE